MSVPVQYLKPGKGVPQGSGPWLIIEHNANGRWYGSGECRNEAGEGVFYASAPEDDITLSTALAGALRWADGRQTLTIYVQEAVQPVPVTS